MDEIETIMLKEISQIQKDTYCMIPLWYLYEVPKTEKFIKVESRIELSRG